MQDIVLLLLCTFTFAPLQHGMIPLSGAQLHKSVDIEGQALQPDLKSGRQEDRLAFRLSFVSNESLYFRVARPNELKGWVERLEKVRENAVVPCTRNKTPPLTKALRMVPNAYHICHGGEGADTM